jgi:hypothetical protein
MSEKVNMKQALICLLLCAWIMWARGPEMGADWFASEAFPTYEYCNAKKKESQTIATSLRYECFPDTIDPRQQKR